MESYRVQVERLYERSQCAETISAEIRAALTFSAQVRMVAPKSRPRSDYKSELVDFSGAP